MAASKELGERLEPPAPVSRLPTHCQGPTCRQSPRLQCLPASAFEMAAMDAWAAEEVAAWEEGP